MAFNKAKALEEAERSVSQGKISQAIKQYLQIIEKDPSDLNLLNTVGDLYAREKNVPAALKLFKRLAEAYVREGFTVKAIAIYKKVGKLVPKSVEPILTLAELYLTQGLTREAREQYVQAFELYKHEKQSDRALDMLRKIVQLDPENLTHRARLAAFCEELKLESAASQAYLEIADAALRQGNSAVAESALKKAQDLDPRNPQVSLQMARLALKSHHPEKVEKIIASRPELKSDRTARQLLFEAYLAARNLADARKLAVEICRTDPTDFAPVGSLSALRLDSGDIEGALSPLTELADELIEKKSTGPLMDALRRIWGQSPQHLPTLQLILQICERTDDEFTLPEILEALGHAYVQAGKLKDAEAVYRKLLSREPENEQHKRLLKQVLQMQGKEFVPAQTAVELSRAETALVPEAEPVASAPTAAQRADAEKAAMVKEVLENSDLYSRYGLADKAVVELERALALYPDELELHRRVFEVCQRNLPARAAQAAEAVARLYMDLDDPASAKKYRTIAQGAATAASQEAAALSAAGLAEAPIPPAAESVPAPPAIEASGTTEPTVAEEPTVTSLEPPGAAMEAEPLGEVIPRDSVAAPPEASGQAEEIEFDLTGEWEAVTATVAQQPTPVAEAPPFNYEESRVEIDFYLEHGFPEQAQKTVGALERSYPGNPSVAELRQRFEKHLAAQPELREVPVPFSAEPEIPSAAGPSPAKAAAAGVETEEWELPETFAQPVPAGPEAPAVAAAPPQRHEHAGAEAGADASQPPVPASDVEHILTEERLVRDEGFAVAPLPSPAPTAAEVPALGESGQAASPLSSLLEELAEPAGPQEEQGDPETLYNLGVAFREMGLLDEAIGEFQKLLRSTEKGSFPPHYLQACSLLALSFMDKKMPAIAARWYMRALESPDLDDAATLALQYDLGLAYEAAGETRKALERFLEVYSQNIDYRDVAEKIRLLQEKDS